MNVQLSSVARGPKTGLNLHLHPYFVCVSRKCSGKMHKCVDPKDAQLFSVIPENGTNECVFGHQMFSLPPAGI